MAPDGKPERKRESPEESIDRLADAIASGRSVDDPADAAGSAPGAAGDAGVAGDAGDSAVVANLIALSRLSEFHRLADPERVTDDAAGAETWGPLRLLEKVGEGSFGEVYRAWDTRLHRLVALKLQRRTGGEAAARALREGRLLARVDHPGVVRIFGADEIDGRVGLWMEFLEGETLEARLRRSGPLPAEVAARAGAELAEALAAIHAAGLVHGDVKAANAMFDPDGRARLMDFGAGVRAAEREAPALAATPLYAAPELLAGGTPSPGSDLYALGVLLHKLVTDRFPVEAASAEELRAVHESASAERPPAERSSVAALRPDLPAGLAAAIDRATAPDPAARWRSAEELARALRAETPEAAEAASGPVAPAPPAAPAPARASRRPLRIWLVAALLGAVAVAWWRIGAGPAAPLVSDAQWLRGAAPERALRSGDTVTAGDLLHLSLDLERAAWIYVLNRDDAGSLSLLFPLPGYALSNPVAPGDGISLPGPAAGSADPLAWEMSGTGGTERFVVIASADPLEEFEKELVRLPRPGDGASARELGEPAAAYLYRGVAGLSRLPAGDESDAAGNADAAGDRLFELARAISEGDAAPRSSSVWVRELWLRNAD